LKVEYYAFALFLTGLICLIAIICKVLFSNVKSQRKLIDEKESKLLQLYRTVESIMEEFNDQVKATTAEIREYEDRTALIAALVKQTYEEQGERSEGTVPLLCEAEEPSPRSMNNRLLFPQAKSDTQKIQAAPANSDNGSVFQRFFDETMMQQPPTAPDMTSKQARNEAVLTLAQEGKTDAQIASELGITQNEVKLIIGLTGKKA